MIPANRATTSNRNARKIIPHVHSFELGNGNTGKKTIVEPMLVEKAVAYQRALREFLDNGYKKRGVSFQTWRTDIVLNSIILVRGLKYKVVAIDITSDQKKVVSTVRGVRYE